MHAGMPASHAPQRGAATEPGAIRTPRRRADVQGAHAQRVGLGLDEVFWTPWTTRGSKSCHLGNHNHRQ
jgi:hypothetical protein